MGQKVNPIGFRLAVSKDWRSKWFAAGKDYAEKLHEDLRIRGYMRQRLPCNWKLMFENIKDPYHATLLHAFLVTFGLFRADNPSSTKMDKTGRHSVLVSQRGKTLPDGLTLKRGLSTGAPTALWGRSVVVPLPRPV